MLHSLVDKSSSGALSAVSVPCAWIALTSSAAGNRVGDSTADSTHGTVLGNGVPFILPPMGNANAYDLKAVYVYIGGGAISVTYEVV